MILRPVCGIALFWTDGGQDHFRAKSLSGIGGQHQLSAMCLRDSRHHGQPQPAAVFSRVFPFGGVRQQYSLWSQVGLLYGEFFLPVLVAILCSYVWRLEHLGKNWNMIMVAPVSGGCIFFAKWIVVAVMLGIVQLFFVALYVAGGLWAGIGDGLPGELAGWLFRGWIASLTIATLQLALSMGIRSFAVPVGIGLCAAFAGLGMYVMHLGMFFPHSLLTNGMGALNQSSLTPGETALFAAMNLLFMLGISAVSIGRLRRADVVG